MNSKVLAIFLYSCLLFLSSQNCIAQDGKIYGVSYSYIGQSKRGYDYKCALLSFDYQTGEYDTVIAFPEKFLGIGSSGSIDPFNDRYFFLGAIDTPDITNLFVVNILDRTYETQYIPGNEIPYGSYEYDPFQNSLICHASGNIYSFDLNTFKYNILSPEIAPDISQGGSNGQAYNYLDQQYLYLNGIMDSLYYYSILVSGKDGSFIDSSHISNNKVSWCPYEHSNVPMGLIYDYNTDSYFGVIPEPEPIDCYVTIARVVRFDPLSGTSDSITTFYNLNTLNEQAVSFDPKNRIYMVPSVYDSFKNGKDTLKDSLVLIDLNNNGFIKKIPFFPQWNLQRFGGYDTAFIQPSDSQLRATFGKGYTWYLNGNLLATDTAQSLLPENTGYYQAKILFNDGKSHWTNKVYYDGVTSVQNPNNSGQSSLQVMPNPLSTNCEFKLNGTKSSNPRLCIYDAEGTIVFQSYFLPNGMIQFHNDRLPDGVYFCKVFTDDQFTLVTRMTILH